MASYWQENFPLIKVSLILEYNHLTEDGVRMCLMAEQPS